jgi:hypothetical protein
VIYWTTITLSKVLIMSDLLTNELDLADALIDMSNILRNIRLGGHGLADLTRMNRVGEALAMLYKTGQVAILAVADRSLLERSDLLSDPRQRREIRRWASEGLILVEGKADTSLLLIVGHRREFPWLDDSDDAVLEPRVDHRGEISLHHVTLHRRSEWDLSISEENDLLVQQGLASRVEILDRLWSCPEARCPRHDPIRAPFLFLPRIRGNRAFCDLHGLDMIDFGRRPRLAQIKIMSGGREVRRFTVQQGRPATAGRSAGVGDLTPYLDETTSRRVSRAHLRFDLSATGLTITDMSRNGTVLFHRDGSRHSLHQATRPFSVGDRAQISAGLELIRSGRRYPSELIIDREIARHRTGHDPSPPTISL